MSEIDLKQKIIKYRKQLGLSQSELARKARITSAAISTIEKGNRTPSITTIKKLCETFNISIDSFINHKTISMDILNKFYYKFSILRNLSIKNQNLIIKIAERLRGKHERD